jgi:Xaa-Pro dipeptidase
MHFASQEYDARVANARKILKERDLAVLLIFAQESHFYLTGYDTGGYVFFQCAVLTAESDEITLLTRRPDVQQAKETSTITDIRVWYDAEGANPANALKAILEEKGLAGARVGVELSTYGLTGFNWERVRVVLSGWCELVDASSVVQSLRVVKSPAELAYVRKAASLADDALLAMIDACRAGNLDTQVSAAGLSVILVGGGDSPPTGPLVNSGPRALYGRGVCGEHVIEEQDQVTLEFAATYHRYNACIMRTAVVGAALPQHREMFAVVSDTIGAMTEAAKPGRPLGEIDDAHRRVFDAAGHQVHRFAACGYSLGATYRPTWMDVPPMLYSGNPTPAQPGMVLFLHAMLADPDTGVAMSLGHTLVVTESGREVLSGLEPELPNRR